MRNLLSQDAAWTQRYEALRRHVLDEPGRLSTAPLGLRLFFREGLAGWMRQWHADPPPETPASHSAACSPSTADWQRELTFLLANLATLQLQPPAMR